MTNPRPQRMNNRGQPVDTNREAANSLRGLADLVEGGLVWIRTTATNTPDGGEIRMEWGLTLAGLEARRAGRLPLL